MDKKITKITMYRNTETNLFDAFVVSYQDDVELVKNTDNTIFQDTLKSKVEEYIKASSSSEYNDLNINEKLKLLQTKGVFEIIRKDIISNLELKYKGEDINSYKVTYASGKKIVVKINEKEDFTDSLKNVIRDLKETYKTGNTTKLQEFGVFSQKKQLIKNLKVTKKGIAILVGASIALGASIGIKKLVNNYASGSNEQTSQTDSMLDSNTHEYDTLLPGDYVDNINLLPDVELPAIGLPTVNNEIVAEIMPGYDFCHNLGENTYDYSFGNLDRVSKGNFSDIGDYLLTAGEYQFKTVGTKIYYDKLFTETSDKVAIKYFSTIRNAIVEQAFKNRDLDGVRHYVNLSSQEIIKFIFGGLPIKANINGQVVGIYYDSLTKEAKDLLLNMAFEMVSCLGNDNFEYNGEIYDIQKTSEIISNEYSELKNNTK